MSTTKKPDSGVSSEPKMPVKAMAFKETSPGIRVLPIPAKPKFSIENDNAKRESMFNNRGAVKPWKPKGGRAKSRGSSDVKAKPISQKVGDSTAGISTKTGYKVIR